MKLSIESVHMGGAVVVLAHERFKDERGFFMETFRADHFRELGLPTEFKQDNLSRSSKGVVRGLHFQYGPPHGQADESGPGTCVSRGGGYSEGLPYARPSLRHGVSAEDGKQVWAPAGFARGFCVLSDTAEIQYKCTAIYNHATESGIRWNDPALGIRLAGVEPDPFEQRRECPHPGTTGSRSKESNNFCLSS